MENELWRASAKQIADGIRQKTFTCREVVDSCLDRIADVNHALRALSHIRPEDARAQADRADAALAAGEPRGGATAAEAAAAEPARGGGGGPLGERGGVEAARGPAARA